MKKFKCTYSSNNSGGGWWLSDNDWKNLEKEGWGVDWGPYRTGKNPKKLTAEQAESHRFLKALATQASIVIEAKNEREAEIIAINRFEEEANQSYYDEGCSCCGRPHYISIMEIE